MKHIYKIAFTGKMGSGKTAASIITTGLLMEKYNEDAIGTVIKFANPIYQTVKAFHRTDNPRIFKQRLGDLARREFGDDIFEKIFAENVQNYLTNRVPELEQNHIVLMTDDLRFIKEYEVAKRFGFTIIRLSSDEDTRRTRIGDASFINTKHRSEIEQDLFVPDFTVNNNVDDPLLSNFENLLRDFYRENKLLGEL